MTASQEGPALASADQAGAARIAAGALLVTVATQIAYFAVMAGGGKPPAQGIWSVEAALFLAVTVAGLVLLARDPQRAWLWAAVAASGLLNVIQVGMGLAVFGPLEDAGPAMAPAFGAVLAGAFFLYFAAKVLIGVAALLAGLALVRGGGLRRIAGAVLALAGGAALALNGAGMALGMDWVVPAGAAGTVATALLGVAMLARHAGPASD